jgi:hypothetical protein
MSNKIKRAEGIALDLAVGRIIFHDPKSDAIDLWVYSLPPKKG